MKQITLSRENFEELMKQYTAEYTLGIHNFQDGLNTRYEYRQSTNNGIQNRIDAILQIGLEIEAEKALQSTIYFKDNIEMYLNSLGGVIIAVPKILKYGDESIFIGSPTEHNKYYSYGRDIKVKGNRRSPRFDRNHSFTSLCDIVLPDEIGQRQTLSSIFILAIYKQEAENEFTFSFNPKHIVYNKGNVPLDFFYSKKQLINEVYKECGISEPIIGIPQSSNYLQATYKTIYEQESYYGGFREAMLETLEQLQTIIKEKKSLKNRIKYEVPPLENIQYPRPGDVRAKIDRTI